MAVEPLLDGLLYGRIPIIGKKDWMLYYVEVTEKHFHIYEGNDSPSRSRKHLQSLELHSSDKAGQEGRDKKLDYKFFYDRGSGGRYVFKCQKQEQREEWVMTLQKLIQRRDYLDRGVLADDSRSASLPISPILTKVETPTPPMRTATLPSNNRMATRDTPPPPPPHQRPHPYHKRDSGFVSGTGVVSQTGCYHSNSADGEVVKSNSGDSSVVHNTAVKLTRQSNSADGSFVRSSKTDRNNDKLLEEEDDEDFTKYMWYWGPMSREECGRKLMQEGQIGNFIVRKNDRGSFVMSFWRKDGVHHHRILKNGNAYRFERSAVDAEGIGIPDLLDTYMKHCSDKTIGPFGGELYPGEIYDAAWNPPEIDFNKFEKVLNKQAQETGMKRLFKPGAEMGNNTYGGMSLDEVKAVIEQGESATNAKLPPSPSIKPKPSPAVTKPSPNRLKPSTAPRPPSTQPKPQKTPPPPTGYVNLFPNKSPLTPRPSYEDKSPVTRRVSTTTDEDDDDEEEEQEVYIAPGELEDEDEQPVYENHNFTPLENNTTRDTNSYANVDFNSSTADAGIYQNVTMSGKPFTPPRQIRPSPRVKPKHK